MRKGVASTPCIEHKGAKESASRLLLLCILPDWQPPA